LGVHGRRLPARTGLPYWMVQTALREWINFGVMRRDGGRIRICEYDSVRDGH